MIAPEPYRDLTPWEGVPAHKTPADIRMAQQRARAVRNNYRLKRQICGLQSKLKCREARIMALEELLREARHESKG